MQSIAMLPLPLAPEILTTRLFIDKLRQFVKMMDWRSIRKQISQDVHRKVAENIDVVQHRHVHSLNDADLSALIKVSNFVAGK
jgi:hypothetical protein